MDPNAKIDAIESDVDQILELYNYAEKVFPYSNIHGPRADNENDNRKNMNSFADSQRPDNYLQAGTPYTLLFVYLMSRGGANGLLDMTQLFRNPARTVGWIFLGNSIFMFWRFAYLKSQS